MGFFKRHWRKLLAVVVGAGVYAAADYFGAPPVVAQGARQVVQEVIEGAPPQ